MKTVPLGAHGEAEQTVELRHTLTAHNPALPPVYSTPNMIGLMEKAAFYALQPYCEDDEITVGTAINIEHRASTGIGARIRAEAALESVNGRFYTLRVTARDETGELGRGTVGRAVVKTGKFPRTDGPPDLKAKAEALRKLHHGPRALVLVNAWDVASARLIEESGALAVATTSAGIAFAQGYPDGQKISRAEMLEAVRRIARAMKVPVTADVESGYGQTPEDAALAAHGVIDCGAVGLNLEDEGPDAERPLAELSLQVEKVRAMREAAEKTGVGLVLNARTDVYLKQIGSPDKRYDETVRRLSAFRDAGADCVFAPGVQDAETIGRLVRDLKCPVNILVGPGSPSIPELEKLGVARVSLGSSAMRASLGHLHAILDEIMTGGTYKALERGVPYPELNKLLG